MVFFTAKPGQSVDAIVAGLSLLQGIKADVPGLRVLEIAPNARLDPSSPEIDVAVYGEFDDAEALAMFKAHPLYAQAVQTVRPLRSLRYVADLNV